MASDEDAVNITEKRLIVEVLELYKDFPCLWDTSNELYCNKDARNQALEIILEKWKKGYPLATIEDVKKKIENLRGAYRRERKKVESSKSTGAGSEDVHNPSLWYYPYLTFLHEKTIPTSQGIDNISETSDIEEPATKKERSSIKRQNALYKKQEELIQSATQLIKESSSHEDTSADAFGRSVSSQLKELPKLQRCIVEKMIGELLFYAKLGELSLDASINLNKNIHTGTQPYYTQPHRSLLYQQHSLPSSPCPQYLQKSPSPQYLQSSPSPQYSQTSQSPKYSVPSPSPKYWLRSPSPQYLQPSPSPQHSRPSLSPQHSQPLSSQHSQQLPSQHSQPSPSQHSQPSPSPQYLQPSPSPQHSRPSLSPQHSQPLSSQHSQQLPSQHSQQLPSQHSQPSPSQHSQPSPSPQHSQPSPSQHSQSSPSPQHSQPSPSPQHSQQLSSPHYLQHSSSLRQQSTPSVPQTPADSFQFYAADQHAQYLPLGQVILPNNFSETITNDTISDLIPSGETQFNVPNTSASGSSTSEMTQTVFRGRGKELQEFLILKK